MSYVTLMGGKAGSSSFKTKPDTLRSDDSFEMLLGLGSGRWKGLTRGLKSLYINNVPLENDDNSTNFKDFAVFFADGDPAQEQLVNFKLGGGGGTTQVGTSIGNSNASGPGPWVTAAVTTPNADFIDLRFVISALYYQDKKGIRENTMNIQVEMRPSGTSQWINPMQSNTAPNYNQDGYYVDVNGVKLLLNRGFWNVAGNQWNDPNPGVLAITGKTTSPFVKELRIAVPNSGQYANKTWEVRVRLNDKELVQNDPIEERRTIQWESIAAVTKQVFGADDAWRGLAWLQVVGKASDQLSGVPSLRGIYETKIVKTPPSSIFDPVTRQYTGTIWDGSYALNYTNDPAWCLKDLIEDPLSGIAALSPGATLDKWDALEISKYCSQLVSDGKGGTHPRFSMNLKIDQTQNAEELIQYMAGAVNAIAWDSGDGVWRMKQDKPENPVALFTRDNIIGEFTYQHTDVDTRYNDYTVTFLNKDNNYTEDRARVYNQADIDQFGRKPTTVVAIGANNRQEALRRAMFRLRVSLNENKIVNFVTNRQGMLLRPLDTILVADTDLGYVGTPTASDNRTTTRLASRSGTTLNLGSSVRLENGVDYVVAFTYPNPSYNPDATTQPQNVDWKKPTITISRTVTNNSAQRGDVSTIYIDSALPESVAENAVVALSTPNLPSLPRQYRVIDVTPQDDEFVSISALIVDTGKHSASDNVNEAEILGQVSNSTVPAPEAPADGMFDVILYEGELGPQRTLGVSWLRPGSLFLQGFKVEYNINNGPWIVLKENINDTYVELQNPTNGTYNFRITALDRRGRQSMPLYGTIELDETSGAGVLPPHDFGPLANRPAVGIVGQRFTTTDQIPNVTYIWADTGEWVIESTINEDAGDLPFDGQNPGQGTIRDVVNNLGQVKLDIDYAAPSIPTNLQATSTVTTDASGQQVVSITATWNGVTATDLAGYVVSVRENGGSWVEFLVGKGSTSWTNKAVANAVYDIRVASYDTQNNRSGFTPVVTVAGAKDNVPPGVPTALNIEASLSSLFLRWTNPADTDLASIQVWESASNNSAAAAYYANVNAMPSLNGAYTRTGLSAGSTRWFFLKAVDTSGNVSGFSAGIQGTVPSLSETDFTPTASGITPIKIVASLPTTENYENRTVAYNGRIYVYKNGAWTSGVYTDIDGNIEALVKASSINGQITGTQIADLAATKLTGTITTTQISDNAISTPKLLANAITAEKLAAGSVTTSKLLVIPTSICPDPYFTDYSFWSGTQWDDFNNNNGNSWYIEQYGVGAAAVGSRMVTLWYGRSPGTARKHIWSSKVACPSAGTVVRLKAKVETNGTNQNVYVLARFYDANNSEMAAYDIRLIVSPGTQGDLTAQGTVPTGATQVAFIIHQEGGTEWAGYARVAGVTLDVAASAELIVDGAVTANKIGADAVTANKIAANSIAANKLVVASRPVSAIGFNFRVDTDNVLRWDGGTIAMIDDNGNYTGYNVTGGEAGYDSNYIYLVYVPGRTYINATIDFQFVQGNSSHIHLATWQGGSRLDVKAGAGTLINGDKIVTSSINANRIVADSITAAQIAAGAISASEIAAGAITASKIGVRGENLFPDPQVQDINWWKGPSQGTYPNPGYISPANPTNIWANGWTLNPNDPLASVDVGGSRGHWFLYSGNNNDAFTSTVYADVVPPSIMAKSNTTYEFKVGCYNASNKPCHFQVQYFDAAGEYITGEGLVTFGAGDTTSKQYAKKFTTPNNCVTIRPYWNIEQGAAFSGYIRVGNISVREAASGTMIVDGSITADHIIASGITGDVITAGTLNANRIATNTSMPGQIYIGTTGVTIETTKNVAYGANEKADTANNSLDIIASDNWLSKGEKSILIREWDGVSIRRAYLIDQANNVGISYSNADTEVNNLANYLTSLSPYWADLNSDTPVDGAYLRSRFNAAKNALDDLERNISNNINTKTNNAINTLNVIASDGWLSKSEKPEMIRQWEALGSAVAYVNDQANAAGVDASAMVNAHNALANYLVSLSPNWGDAAYDTPVDGAYLRSLIQNDNNAINDVRRNVSNKTYGYANDPANVVNNRSTTIDPGKILISGGTTLASWRNGGDTTKIEGGLIATNTILANSIKIGSRNISTVNIDFYIDGNTLRYDGGGHILLLNDNGQPQSFPINAFAHTDGSNWLYVYWTKGSTNFGITGDWGAVMGNQDNVFVGTWSGGKSWTANWGGTIIDGSRIVAQTIQADRLSVGSLSAISANLGTVTSGQIIIRSGNSMKVIGNGFGSAGQFLEWSGPSLANTNQCTEANAISFLKTNGQSYYAGGIIAGSLRSSVSNSSTATSASTSTGVIGSNGNSVSVNGSYAYNAKVTVNYPATSTGLNDYNTAIANFGAASSDDGGYTHYGTKSDPQSGFSMTLRRDGASIANIDGCNGSITIYGARPVIGDAGGYIEYTYDRWQAVTTTDPYGGTANRTYTAEFSRSFSSGSAILQSQRISVTSTEW